VQIHLLHSCRERVVKTGSLNILFSFNASITRASLVCVAVAVVTASGVVYGQASSEGASEGRIIEEVVVTGIRKSLSDAIDLKRDSVLTTESINSEDMGKFPDLNLAESLQRTSGIAITRDNGEGQQISLRGLGPSFARVLWNGVPISTASNGGTDTDAVNREFDFDVFSSELFSGIDVAKSAAAHQVEGGISGVVNLRNARPFDFDGFKASVAYKHGFQDLADETDPNASFIISNTFADDTFGALFGIVSTERSVRVDGYESQDWVSQSANGFTFDTSGGNNSGLSAAALDSLLLPRLPRTEVQFGTRERVSYVAAFQYRPDDDIELNLDILSANLESDIQRHNFDVEIRNQTFVPLNAVVDSNNKLRSIRLQGVNRRSENRVFTQETDQLHVALSGTWRVAEKFKLDGALAHAKSEYDERLTTFFARAQGTEVTINMPGGSRPIPEIVTPIDITDPSNFSFNSMRINPQDREEENMSFHIDATWGDEFSNLRFGLAYDTFERDQNEYRSSGNPSDFANTVPALSEIAGVLPFDDYLDDLGATADVFTNHLIINPSAAERFFDLDALDAAAPVSETDTHDAEEKTLSGYLEINHITEFLGRDLRFNAGARIVSTDLNVAAPFEGSEISFSNSYTKVLPSFNLAWDVRDDIVVRLSAARAMTRPDISALVPVTDVESDFSVESGNPELEPFLSDQLSIGIEWYFAEESVLAFSTYQKDITGFIQTEVTQGPFSQSGVDISTLDQQIFATLTPGTIVDFVRPENSSEPTEMVGFELLYQQPLTFIAEGAGVMLNYSKITGDTSFVASGGEEVPSNIVGLSEINYNIVLYYETVDYSLRGSWNYRDDFTTAPCCRNGQPFLRTREGSGQFDISAAYTLPFVIPGVEDVTLTLEGINLNENEEYTYFGDTRNLQRYIGSGRQFFLGVRASL
jgi:iron complex outermembrane recepter protein